MILLLGATGYIGQAFVRALQRRREPYVPLSRQGADYTDFDILLNHVRQLRPSLVIDAAGYSGKPNIDACESERVQTLRGNVLLPQTIARVCMLTHTPGAHISSGCIYNGAKVFTDGNLQLRNDLNNPELRQLFTLHPEAFLGFTEYDEPNFSFRSPPCNFFAGTKALAEETLRRIPRTYIWRTCMPFDSSDSPCNFLIRLQSYPKVYDHITSLSHVEDFANACLQLVDFQAPYGIYNVVNPGAMSTRQIVQMLERAHLRERPFEFWENDEEFYARGAKVSRSSCILDGTKLCVPA